MEGAEPDGVVATSGLQDCYSTQQFDIEELQLTTRVFQGRQSTFQAVRSLLDVKITPSSSSGCCEGFSLSSPAFDDEGAGKL